MNFKYDDPRGYYLGVDPGATTGVVLCTEGGIPLIHENLRSADDFSDFLTSIEELGVRIRKVIVEDYTIFKHRAKAHIGSNLPASRIIGRMEDRAKQWGVDLVKQPASILPMAEKLTNNKMSSHGAHSETHWVSAHLHVCYYLIQNDLMLTWAQAVASRERAKTGQ